jgi:hypothetical protein
MVSSLASAAFRKVGARGILVKVGLDRGVPPFKSSKADVCQISRMDTRIQ